MPTASDGRHAATAADLMAISEPERFHEVVDGELVRKPAPSGRHGHAQAGVAAKVGRGWWTVVEVEIEFEAHQVYRPDVAGWRRERLPAIPHETPITVRPDWVCEVLSESNASNDLVKKMRGYHRAGVPHYWIVAPRDETLTVYRWTAEGFLLVLAADREERVHAEPFVEVQLFVGSLFGEDDD
jgi:Uma2 family endonuclease